MPRIREFQYQHPEISLMLNPTAELVDLKPGGIDIAIRYRGRDRLESDVATVLTSDMVVIGTPSLVSEPAPRAPAMFADMPWLQELGTNEVADWMARAGA